MQQPVIAPFQSGLNTTLAPWLAPEDSFRTAVNVHLHNGYIEKRNGFNLFGQLQGMDTSINITGISNANPAVVTVGSTAGLANGQRVYISGVTGMTEVNDGIFIVAALSPTTFELQGINSTLFGVYAGAGTVQPIIDDTDRVMGIYRYITANGTQETLAFNTTRANRYDAIADVFLPLDAAPIMSSSATDYVWAVNWNSADVSLRVNRLYFTNGKAQSGSLDGIRYYDGTSNTTTAFVPNLDITGTDGTGARKVIGAKLMFVLKSRLVLLYTIEDVSGTVTTHYQRARWCQAQGSSEWRDAIAGKGGFVDAPTGDHIISARALQNEIIVFFTNSVWSLRPVGDPALPFRWIKINDFRSCYSKMSSVGYDKTVNALGNRGITATNGTDTQRMDQAIENFTTNVINLDQFEKLYCARSYENERWWTLYTRPTDDVEDPNDENNSALIYDDRSASFTIYDISLNCLGYGNVSKDWAIQDFTAANNHDWTFEDGPSDETIDSFFFSDQQEIFLGGDINGQVLELESGDTDNGNVIEALILTNQWSPYKAENRECRLNFVDIYFDTDQETEIEVIFFKDDMFDPYTGQTLKLLPNLDYICEVIDITQANPGVATAPNHGLTTGDRIFFYSISGMNDVNNNAYIVTVVDANHFTFGIDTTTFGAFTGSGGIYKRKFYRTRTFNRVFAGGIGYFHNMQITTTRNLGTLRIHAFKPKFTPLGKRTINP